MSTKPIETEDAQDADEPSRVQFYVRRADREFLAWLAEREDLTMISLFSRILDDAARKYKCWNQRKEARDSASL